MLWIEYALAMVTGAGLVFDSASIYTGVAHSQSGAPTNLAAVMLLVLLACAMAVVNALPANLPRDHLLRWIAATFTVVSMLVDPWAGAVLQSLAVVAVALNGRRFQPVLDVGVVALAYVLLYSHAGVTLVVLSIVMTMLMGALTMMITVVRQTFSLWLIVVVLAIVAASSGLASTF